MKAVVPQSMIEASATARFLVGKTFANDEESTPYFRDQLNNSTFYLEYGTGGSTVRAATKGKTFIAVESDSRFVNSVQNTIGQLRHDQTLIDIDIGFTGPWGVPVFKKPTKSLLSKWRQYPAAPWALITEEKLPDLILIDGRFRVSCALGCLKQMSQRAEMKLLSDDIDRPSYHMVERFAQLTTMVGRMAVFSMAPFDADALDRELENHYSDWR